MATTTYKVSGMTCGHCVQSVTSEIEKVEGVQDVKVDLETGAVTVTSGEELSEDSVRAAVDEAGFELVQ